MLARLCWAGSPRRRPQGVPRAGGPCESERCDRGAAAGRPMAEGSKHRREENVRYSAALFQVVPRVSRELEQLRCVRWLVILCASLDENDRSAQHTQAIAQPCSIRHDAPGDERWQPLRHCPVARSPKALAARPGSLRCHYHRAAARAPEAHVLAARPGSLRWRRNRVAARSSPDRAAARIPEARLLMAAWPGSLLAARPRSLVGPGVLRPARYQTTKTRATPWPRRTLVR